MQRVARRRDRGRNQSAARLLCHIGPHCASPAGPRHARNRDPSALPLRRDFRRAIRASNFLFVIVMSSPGAGAASPAPRSASLVALSACDRALQEIVEWQCGSGRTRAERAKRGGRASLSPIAMLLALAAVRLLITNNNLTETWYVPGRTVTSGWSPICASAVRGVSGMPERGKSAALALWPRWHRAGIAPAAEDAPCFVKCSAPGRERDAMSKSTHRVGCERVA